VRAYRGSGVITPLILNLRTSWKWVVNLTHWPRYIRGNPLNGDCRIGLDISETRTIFCPYCCRRYYYYWSAVSLWSAGIQVRYLTTRRKLCSPTYYTISKSFRKYVSKIPGNHKVKELQKTAILGTECL
jgi:hypothetical protein